MKIDKSYCEPIPQFNIGDEVVFKSSGAKAVVMRQDGTTVSTWYPLLLKSSFGYEYISPQHQAVNAFELTKTGKSYAQVADMLSQLL